MTHTLTHTTHGTRSTPPHRNTNKTSTTSTRLLFAAVLLHIPATQRNTNKTSTTSTRLSSLLLLHFHVHVAGEFVFQLFHFLLKRVSRNAPSMSRTVASQKYISSSPLRPVLLVVVVLLLNGDIFVSIRSASMFNPHFASVSVTRDVIPGKFVALMISFLYPRDRACASLRRVSGGTSLTSHVNLSMCASSASCSAFFVLLLLLLLLLLCFFATETSAVIVKSEPSLLIERASMSARSRSPPEKIGHKSRAGRGRTR